VLSLSGDASPMLLQHGGDRTGTHVLAEALHLENTGLEKATLSPKSEPHSAPVS